MMWFEVFVITFIDKRREKKKRNKKRPMSITVQRQLALSDLTSSKRGQTGGIERKPERKRKEIYMSWHRTAHRTYRFEQEEERREKKIAIIMYYLLSLTPSSFGGRATSKTPIAGLLATGTKGEPPSQKTGALNETDRIQQ